MIKLKIREMAEVRGIKNAYQLQKAMDVPPGMAARLWRSNMRMIGLDTIDSLCEALDCEPADLIVRVVDSKKTSRKAQ
jgi:DNA-binding Xre family transcriptional regulator